MDMNADHPLRILLAGATGLVGQGVALACRTSPQVTELSALVRRVGSVASPIREIVLHDFLDAGELGAELNGFDACFYCAGAAPLGTPAAEYRRITLQATLAVARAWAAANPYGRFLYISGAGANPASRFMPMRIKGETEQALAALPIRTLMLRPGGVRPVAGTGTGHPGLKPLYWVGTPLLKLAGRVAPAWVTSNLAIGQAMIVLTCMGDPPAVVECAQINRLAARTRTAR